MGFFNLKFGVLRAGSINNNEQNQVNIADGFTLSFPANFISVRFSSTPFRIC